MSSIGKMGKSIGKGKGGKISAKRHLNTVKDPIEGVTKPAIRRLARRAGIKRINGHFYDEVRGILKQWMEHKLNMALTYTKYARRNTLFPADVFHTLKRCGETLYGFDHLGT